MHVRELNIYDRVMENIPISVEEIYNLLIKDREALKMDVSTDMVKIKVPISTIFSRSQHKTDPYQGTRKEG